MGVNKVKYGENVVLDISSDTVTADKLLQGYTAHDKSGALIIGTATGGGEGGNVWQDANGYLHLDDESGIDLQTKSVTPSETAQTVTPDAGYYALEEVNVGAISSSYVGSGITRRSSSDMTVSGATVTAPSGYYSASASKSVASGTAGTPTATKGTVSNHSVSVTPSVANTTGYITGGTKNGTAVSVSASELVSGTLSITSSGTKDVTNYASASVASGSATASATKGTVSNHSISVTPSVTRTAGYITAGSSNGTAVSVSASELVSGTLSVTSAGTKDVTNYASASIPSGTEGTPTATKGTVSNHSVSVTPSVTNTTGYITGGTRSGTAVSVSASELVSGTKSITENGTSIDVTNYASVDVAVPSGGGGSSSYTLIDSFEVTANVTSTSATTVSSGISIDTSAFTPSKMIYVKIRDKAGKREGYFYGVDQYLKWVTSSSVVGTNSYMMTRTLKYNNSATNFYTTGASTAYGVYCSEIRQGTAGMTIKGRYHSTYSLTIDGTYTVDIYTLEWPDNDSPFED